MDKQDPRYALYLSILKEELVPAMGCTEPIAIAYAAAKAREVLGARPTRIDVVVSGNIVKNVKSVIVPNTGGLEGIEAAAAAGIEGGQASRVLEVIASVSDEQRAAIRALLDSAQFTVSLSQSGELFDIHVTLYAEGHSASARIVGFHTNLVHIDHDGVPLFQAGVQPSSGLMPTDRSAMTVGGIYDFAHTCDLEDVRPVIRQQIDYNTAIATEGLRGNYGANIGRVLLAANGEDMVTRAKAWAAAGSDARMSGCELPVIINSGSGNQGLCASLPVLAYGQAMEVGEDKLTRALVLSNLCTIHQKTGIGRLSAYCGAVSAGCGAGAGIAYLHGGSAEDIEQTIVNAISIVSGMVCDGAKPSCAAKIAAAVDGGIMGFLMVREGQRFKCGQGLVGEGVERTIENMGRLGRIGMKETDQEILKMMIEG